MLVQSNMSICLACILLGLLTSPNVGVRDTDDAFALEEDLEEDFFQSDHVMEELEAQSRSDGWRQLDAILQMTDDEDTTSELWKVSMDHIMASHVEQRRKELQSDQVTMSLLEAGHEGGDNSSLREELRMARVVLDGTLDQEHMKYLNQQHFLVRNSVLRALGKPTKRCKDLATSVECALSLGDGVCDRQAASESKVEGAKKSSFVASELKKAWSEVKEGYSDLMEFFRTQFTWAVSFDVAPVPSYIPKLGWGCVPIQTCVKQLVTKAGRIMSFFASLTWALVKGLGAAVSRAMTIVGDVTTMSALEKSEDTSTPTSVTKFFHVKGKDDHPPSAADVEGGFDMEPDKLFDDRELGIDRCSGCVFKMVGSIGLDTLSLFNPLEWILGIFKMSIVTVPRPLASFQNSGGNCMTCAVQWIGMLGNKILSRSNATAAEKYFQQGRCNAHSVGMCMLLEKVGTCKVSASALEQGGYADESITRYKAQYDFCDSLDGTNLELTSVRGMVVCPKIYDGLAQKMNLKPIGNKTNVITYMSMKHGCHAVRHTMQAYNAVCEKGEAKYKKAWLYYEYKKDESPQNMKQAVDKCMALYNCKGEGEAVNATGTAIDTSKPFETLSAGILDIVESVNDFAKQPASMSPEEATKRITAILKANEAEMDKFQKNVMEVAGKLEGGVKQDWGPELQTIFQDTLWDDLCFDGLGGSNRGFQTLYEKLDLEEVSFWEIFAKMIGYNVWGRPTRDFCYLTARTFVTLEKVPEKVLVEKMKEEQTQKQLVVATFLLRGEIPQWKKDSQGTVLKFTMLGGGHLQLKKDEMDNSTAWKLESCGHVQCENIPEGSPLTHLGMKGLQDNLIGNLLSGLETFTEAFKSIVQKHSHAHRDENAIKVLNEIISTIQDGKPADFVALAKVVEADEGMAEAFARRSWEFLGNQSDEHRALRVMGSVVRKASQVAPLMTYFKSAGHNLEDKESTQLRLVAQKLLDAVELVSVFSNQAPVAGQPEQQGENMFNWDEVPEKQCNEKNSDTCLVDLRFTFEIDYNAFEDCGCDD